MYVMHIYNIDFTQFNLINFCVPFFKRIFFPIKVKPAYCLLPNKKRICRTPKKLFRVTEN